MNIAGSLSLLLSSWACLVASMCYRRAHDSYCTIRPREVVSFDWRAMMKTPPRQVVVNCRFLVENCSSGRSLHSCQVDRYQEIRLLANSQPDSMRTPPQHHTSFQQVERKVLQPLSWRISFTGSPLAFASGGWLPRKTKNRQPFHEDAGATIDFFPSSWKRLLQSCSSSIHS